MGVTAQEEARLVKENMGRVHYIVSKKYSNYGIAAEDLVQEGAVGLLHAIRKFDPTKGASLGTYASYWIHACIREAIGKSLMSTDHDMSRWAKNGRKTFGSVSIDEPITDDDRGSQRTRHDVMADDSPSPEVLTMRLLDRRRLDKAISRLPKRSASVIASRFDSEETLDVVGTRLGVSRERVRQIEEGALERLAKALQHVS